MSWWNHVVQVVAQAVAAAVAVALAVNKDYTVNDIKGDDGSSPFFVLFFF